MRKSQGVVAEVKVLTQASESIAYFRPKEDIYQMLLVRFG